ncbi:MULTISPECIES: GntR family transcriptional regulator [unclassified Pseudomonas]|uniref:GntR family transcriptional regulator n=1 Tax=Pseudomonas TaxID=286 RepID=UPI000D01852C|nr:MULTISPECIES: GntR family transcriptional regulator [unclassified Pseudomonas]MDR2316209.1 GntR family transcriptional regulator [Pseudomonas sp.]PRN02027.1 GntR family transcriptional regulator [Pseudomonas sp. LLC-1]PYG79219.1 DNA-binding GntR family transcriptional regulator [Pseudomonas sp. RV120224-01c]PYG83453.1 DNA-binding GntR family transcriptional regulator [Pseudomonas sp. RV120224-01b]
MSATQPMEERTASRYETIRNTLREAILGGQAIPGLVLVEGPLAELFGTSRVPVRQALNLLHDEGLIRRFDGRGFLIDPEGTCEAPLRVPLTRKLLGLEPQEDLIDYRPLGERIYDHLAETVIRFMVFGHYRIDEQTAAQELNVSRNVVREALMRLRDKGLVEKEPYAQWLAGPLTAQAVKQDYELRILLEPDALRQGIEHVPRSELESMLKRIITAQEAGRHVQRADIEQLEQDLHVTCIAGVSNTRMAAVIRQCQIPMNVGRVLHEALHTSNDEAMLIEHRLIFEALLYGTVESACSCLRDHILKARERTLQRLKVLSVLPEPQVPGYLQRMA